MLIEGPLIAAGEATVDTAPVPAMIGPHAVIHLVAAMNERLGQEATDAILANAQIATIPTGEAMIPEVEALRLHRWLAMREPIDCFEIAEDAARRTADYIIANRIPSLAVRLLKALPHSLAGSLLMRAIRHHAWTFVGAGRFEPNGAWEFELDRSDADDQVLLPESLFHWYASVFDQLYRRLISSSCRCQVEIASSAKAPCHTFHISPP